MKKMKIALITIVFLLAAVPFEVNAHPGNTDSNGGHYNHSTGEYHYHHGMSAHSHYDVDGDGDIDCPYGYVGNTYPSSGSGCYTNSGWLSDDEFDDLLNESFNEGYVEGYNSGYETGYDDGEAAGYDNAVSKLENEYAEKLANAKDSAYKDGRNIAFLMSALFGIPVVSHFAYAQREKDYQRNNRYNTTKQAIKKTAQQNVTEPSVAKPINFMPDYSEFVIISRSSFISAVCYKKNNLYIKLKTNECYLYYNVLETVYNEFLAAPSMGVFYNEKIIGHYPYSRL